MSAWPDPSRPGVPLNPERDGWHWLLTPDGEDAVYFWRVAGECERGRWPDQWLHSADEWNPTDCTYLGPCLTPADLTAAVQAERERWREALTACHALLVMQKFEPDVGAPPMMKDGFWDRVVEQARALLNDDADDTSALAEAVEAARREGREEVFSELSERHAMYLSDVERWKAKGIHTAARLSAAKAITLSKAINSARAAIRALRREGGGVSICHGCGGVVGRDCYNPVECEMIARDMQRQHDEATALTAEEVSALESLRAGTHALVPREPTEAMREAGAIAFDGPMAVMKIGALCTDIYRAMLAAAQPRRDEGNGDG